MKVIIVLEDGRSAVTTLSDENMALLAAEVADVRRTAECMGSKSDYSAADELAYGIIPRGIASLRERRMSLPAENGSERGKT